MRSHEESEAQYLARCNVYSLGAIKEMSVLARDLAKVLTESQVRALVKCLRGETSPGEEHADSRGDGVE